MIAVCPYVTTNAANRQRFLFLLRLAIFADEPHFCHKQNLRFAAERREIILPFTDDLEQTFRAAYGHKLQGDRQAALGVTVRVPNRPGEGPGAYASEITPETKNRLPQSSAAACVFM